MESVQLKTQQRKPKNERLVRKYRCKEETGNPQIGEELEETLSRTGTMREADKAWIEFAEEVVNASKRELGTKRIGKNPRYGVATRTLQRSLTFKLGKTQGKVDSIQLTASGKAKSYAAFVHWGVNGNQVRHGSPFSYRTKCEESKAALHNWRRAVGAERAQAITTEAAKVEAAAPKPAFYTAPRLEFTKAKYLENSVRAKLGDDAARQYVMAADDTTSNNAGLIPTRQLTEVINPLSNADRSTIDGMIPDKSSKYNSPIYLNHTTRYGYSKQQSDLLKSPTQKTTGDKIRTGTEIATGVLMLWNTIKQAFQNEQQR